MVPLRAGTVGRCERCAGTPRRSVATATYNCALGKNRHSAGVEPDPVASLVIALKRAGVVSAAQGDDLYRDHMAGR